MSITLTTNSELLAEKAEELPAFRGIKLLKIKQELAHLLELIGREQIFNEYTKHDISHIERMLEMLDWLVPEDVKQIMSPSDWLVTVLSIYFHDLGMLVTKREYESRLASGFPQYRDTVLFGGEKGPDYRAKVAEMGEESGERFLYQEFVRHTHAERIRAWITGQSRDRLGISNEVVSVIDDLLTTLDEGFREDLAIVCESHHLDDLNNFKKYKVRRPYGNSDKEIANLQYAAILMRTADLLHVTKDRTPSTSFRLINPADPISQEEWAKQMAVTTVLPQLGKDQEGNFNENAPRDTIEVHARFSKQDGFFALTSYLLYAGGQLRKSHDWAKEANRTQGARHYFPWRRIDDSNIETKGFLPETFGFTIDQPRILKLLTGHTLYNDTNVVLRELVQNSLDAVRLQKYIDEQTGSATSKGVIRIRWNSKERLLTVEDNGTGMSQEIIERNLLTVGASRYEDPEFKKRYPTFSAISRFGIGILSTFMLADVVEILTCSPEDEQARQLSLRSVLGKYLIKLLDKETDEEVRRIAPHGTSVKLKIRHSAETPDVIEIARRWVVVPRCEVTVTVDDNDPVPIGFSTPKAALEQYLKSVGQPVNTDPQAQPSTSSLCVMEGEEDGTTLAYALSWPDYFQEWTFVDINNVAADNVQFSPIGTCIEGVRVETTSPGFKERGVLALANARGSNAPKTNVARSGIEVTPERHALSRSIYSIYCKHVTSEITELHQRRAFSITWAAQESRYIYSSLLKASDGRNEPLNGDLLRDQLRTIPALLIEEKGERRTATPAQLNKESSLWTVDSPSFKSAEYLLREIPGRISISKLGELFVSKAINLPEELTLCGITTSSDELYKLALEGKDVDRMIVKVEERRVDLHWATKVNNPRWKKFPITLKSNSVTMRLIERFIDPYVKRAYSDVMNISAGTDAVEIIGAEGFDAVIAFGHAYILPQSPLAQIILGWFDRYNENPTEENEQRLASLFLVLAIRLKVRGRLNNEVKAYYQDQLKRSGAFETEKIFAELPEITVFEPSALTRPLGMDYL